MIRGKDLLVVKSAVDLLHPVMGVLSAPALAAAVGAEAVSQLVDSHC